MRATGDGNAITRVTDGGDMTARVMGLDGDGEALEDVTARTTMATGTRLRGRRVVGVAPVRSGRGAVAVGAQQACRDCGMKLLGSVAPRPWNESGSVAHAHAGSQPHREQGVHGGGRISRSCWVGIVRSRATGWACGVHSGSQGTGHVNGSILWFSVTYNWRCHTLYTLGFTGHMV